MMKRLGLFFLVMISSAQCFEQFKLEEAWLKIPQTYSAPPETEKPEVKAIFYDGVPFQGKPTRVFAYYGIPKLEAGQKAPAMVLIHGGGGTAFDGWVRRWTKRGYVAISMDTCGGTPTKKIPGDHWQRHEFSGPGGWGDFGNIDRPAEDQWTYHAVSSAIIAHSFLRSLPEVDTDRIAVTGISWGGYLTCIVAGLDTRFKFAAPVYGCGFLGDNSAWLDNFKNLGPERAAKWLKWWDPSTYLKDAEMPILWVNGTNDFAYPPDSYQKSYKLPKSDYTICMKVRMPHGHGEAGEGPQEILTIAESMFRGGKPLAKIVSQDREGPKVTIGYKSESPIVKAELNFTKDKGMWQKRNWEIAPATVDAATKSVTATVPEGATVYYINLIDERGNYVSTEHEELKTN